MFSFPNPLLILQTPREVVMIKEDGMEIRHVYLDVPHSANPKPSWYGESVGHYEGDTLVVDTIGLNARTVLDVYRTPHTEKLHVVERWRTINEGRGWNTRSRWTIPRRSTSHGRLVYAISGDGNRSLRWCVPRTTLISDFSTSTCQ